MENDVGRISFSKLLLRSLLAGTIATLVLFPFHYLMRKVALLPSLPYFEGPIGKVFYLALIFLLAYADLFFVTLIRGRNESSEILGKFVRRGIPLRYLADLLVVFLCCLLSFSIGIALGAEAPSVFMSSLIFGMVFSKGKKNRNLSGEGIRVGGAVGFALAFHNPLAGLVNSFAANLFTSAKRNKDEWKSIVSSLITLVVTYFLYSGLRYLAYSGDFAHWYQCFLFNDYSFELSLIPLSALSSTWAFCFVFAFSLPLAYIYVKSASIGRKFGWKDKASSYRFSLYVGVAICFVLFLFMPKALGTGSAYIDGIEGILAESSSWILCLLLVRFVFTIFSFSSHYSGGTIIPTIGIGMLFGAFIASLSPSSFGGYEILFVCSFALSFFGFVTGNGLLPLALVLSLGFSFPLLIILIPSAILTILLKRYLANLPVLSKGLAEADEANGALKESMFSLFPLCKWQEGLCLCNRTQWRDL